MLGGPFAGRFGSDRRGIRRRLARALEALSARRRPGNGVALRVGDGDHRVVERCIHMRDGRGDVLLFLAPGARGLVLDHEYPAVLENGGLGLAGCLLLACDGNRLTLDLKSTRLNSSPKCASRLPSSA